MPLWCRAECAKARAKRLVTPSHTMDVTRHPHTLLTKLASKEIRSVQTRITRCGHLRASSQVNTLDESSYGGSPPRHKLHDFRRSAYPSSRGGTGVFHSAEFAFILSCFGPENGVTGNTSSSDGGKSDTRSQADRRLSSARPRSDSGLFAAMNVRCLPHSFPSLYLRQTEVARQFRQGTAPAPAAAARALGRSMGSSTWSSSLVSSATARSTVFSSCRTFPGHS